MKGYKLQRGCEIKFSDIIKIVNPTVRDFFEKHREGPLSESFKGLLERHVNDNNKRSDIFRVLVFDAHYLPFLIQKKLSEFLLTLLTRKQFAKLGPIVLAGLLVPPCLGGSVPSAKSDDHVHTEEVTEIFVEADESYHEFIATPSNDLVILEEEIPGIVKETIYYKEEADICPSEV